MENRLVSTSGSAASSFKYDPLGRLHEVTVAGNTTRFLYDGDALVAEYNSSGALTRRYLHGDQIDEPWVQYYGPNLNYERRFLYADHQGSIIAHSNYMGTLSNSLTYDAYGIPGSANLDRFGYTGQIWFKELGLFHYKARMYHPKLGRFLQTDPIFYADNMNMYAYVGNDPVNKIDPTGMTSCTCNPWVEATRDIARRGIAGMKLAAHMIAEAVSGDGENSGSSGTPDFEDIPQNKPPFTGEPGSTVRGGTGSRTYGEDGYPKTDRDLPHPDEAGIGCEDHCHDWSRPEDGSPPTHEDRGPGRAPEVGDPPAPRGPNVPPPELEKLPKV